MRQVINHPNKKEHRRNLRNNLTPAEATLWLFLKNKQLAGRRFKRQVSFGPCHETERRAKYDEARDRYLEELGLRVVRFKNKIFFDGSGELLQEIKGHFRPSCVPPFEGGRLLGDSNKKN